MQLERVCADPEQKHPVFRSLCFLLGNLLCLDSCCILTTERQLRDRHILQEDIKSLSPLCQLSANISTHMLHSIQTAHACQQSSSADPHLSHGQQLAGIVLGQNAL